MMWRIKKCVCEYLANFGLSNSLTSSMMKSVLGVAKKRNLPAISGMSLRKWYNKNYHSLPTNGKKIKALYLFIDEFTNFNDTEIGITAIKLLHKLGYEVKVVEHDESGRSAMSKGLLEKARKHLLQNIAQQQEERLRAKEQSIPLREKYLEKL